ncbi:DUF4158 domain-containing protein [Actinomadura kijaniata]|uniref:DUF4158 domain-containing protein n=1 Tax=Actinomadura kijaniata TaxID=46161 RepID=UPI000A054D55
MTGSHAGGRSSPMSSATTSPDRSKCRPRNLGSTTGNGRTIEYHRAHIRDHLGFRVCAVVDAEKLTRWLAAEVAHAEHHPDRVREELLRHCRQERIEPRPRAGSRGWCGRHCTSRRRIGSRSSRRGWRSRYTAGSWAWSTSAPDDVPDAVPDAGRESLC